MDESRSVPERNKTMHQININPNKLANKKFKSKNLL